MDIDIRFTIGLIIFDPGRNRYLILRRSPKRYRGWGLIKGGVKPDETLQQACVRETVEEIGIVLDEVLLQDLEHASAYYDNTKHKVVLVHWFLTELPDGIENLVLEQEEWVDHRWATYSEAQYELVWQTQQRALKIAHALLSKKERPEEED